jgi:hypothetical protein
MDLTAPSSDDKLSRVLVVLLKGVLHQEDDPPTWQALLSLEARVRDHLEVLGLELLVDEPEGYAFLRQRAQPEEAPELPRLIPRRQLSYPVSLLLALLRKKLAEFDAGAGETRLVLSREQIVELMRVFLADTSNEAKLMDKLDTHLNKVVELGFLRRLRGGKDAQFEVRRLLKAFVDAQWLQDLEQRLSDYRSHADAAPDAPSDREAGS